MPPSKQNNLSRRGRRPSLRVAARKTSKLQQSVRTLLGDLEDLEKRLIRLEALLQASQKADQERLRRKGTSRARGIRGKGPNVRDLAFQVLNRRKRPMEIQEISKQVLKLKKGRPGANFTQNLGAALARDNRFTRLSRGVYVVKR